MDGKIIIHCLWLDFKNKSDGNINDKIEFFLDRIKFLHQDPKYKINFISRWDKLLEQIDGEQWLVNLINNPYVGAAHKSDAIRFYLLNKYGGIWVDISTFLVASFDIYNPDIFTCFYIKADTCISWVISFVSNLSDRILIRETLELQKLQSKFISLKDKYKSYKYVPENYFIICKKGDPICNNVYNQLKTFWSSVMDKINSESDNCFNINKYIWSLVTEFFDIKYQEQVDAYLDNNPVSYKILFDCAYLFNYLQLLKAIIECSKNNPKFEIIKTDVRNNLLTKNNNTLKKYRDYMCEDNMCNTVELSSNGIVIANLLSASYNRLAKWSNKMTERISWDNTYAGNVLNSDTNPDDKLKQLTANGIRQLKFSSWTRDSKIVKKLMELFNNQKYVLKQPTNLFKPNNVNHAGLNNRTSSRKKKEAIRNKSSTNGSSRRSSKKNKSYLTKTSNV